MKTTIQHHANESLIVKNVRKSYCDYAGVLIVLWLIISAENVIFKRIAVTAVEGIINQHVYNQAKSQENKSAGQIPGNQKDN